MDVLLVEHRATARGTGPGRRSAAFKGRARRSPSQGEDRRRWRSERRGGAREEKTAAGLASLSHRAVARAARSASRMLVVGATRPSIRARHRTPATTHTSRHAGDAGAAWWPGGGFPDGAVSRYQVGNEGANSRRAAPPGGDHDTSVLPVGLWASRSAAPADKPPDLLPAPFVERMHHRAAPAKLGASAWTLRSAA
jgi:hypothetical protein